MVPGWWEGGEGGREERREGEGRGEEEGRKEEGEEEEEGRMPGRREGWRMWEEGEGREGRS